MTTVVFSLHHRSILRADLTIALAIAIATFCVFLPSLRYGFVNLDDPQYVHHNPDVLGGLTWEGVRAAFRVFNDEYWIPVLFLSLSANVEAFGTGAWGFHLVNVLLHAVNAAILFLLLRAATKKSWPAALATLLFAVHPLRVESVVWVSQRKDVLSTLFLLLAIAAWCRYARGTAQARSGTTWYALTLVLLTLGLMTKPMLVTFPVLALILDFWPLGRGAISHGDSMAWWRAHKRLLLEKVPLLLVCTLFAAATLWYQRGQVTQPDPATILETALRAPLSYFVYLGKTAWPSGLGLAFRPSAPSLPWVEGLAALAAHAAVLLFLWRAKARRPYLLAGWLWFLVALLPVSGIVPVGLQWISDRFTYVPFMGIAACLAWSADEAAGTPRGKAAMTVGATAVIAALCVGTLIQTRYWASSTALFQRSVRLAPGSARAYYVFGAALAKEGRLDDALRVMEDAVRLAPADPLPLQGLGEVLGNLGRWDEALSILRDVAAISPDSVAAHRDMVQALGKLGDTQGVVVEMENLLALVRSDRERAVVQVELAKVLWASGRRMEAVAHLEEAVRLAPDDASARFNLALALTRLGRMEEAEKQFAQVLRMEPGDIQARLGLAESLAAQGRPSEAVEQFALVSEKERCSARGYLAQGRVAQIEGRPGDARRIFAMGLAASTDTESRRILQAALDEVDNTKNDE